MKKNVIILLLSNMMLLFVLGQVPPEEITRIKNRLSTAMSDSARINVFLELANNYRFSYIDSALSYADKAIDLSRKTNYPAGEGNAISQKGYILLEAGDIPAALQCQFMALRISEKIADTELEAWTLNRIGNTYMELGDFKKAIDYYRISKNLFTKLKKTGYVYNGMSNIGNVYEMMGMLDSCKFYQQQVYNYSLTNTDRYAITYAEMRERLGKVETRLGNYDTALMHYRAGVIEALIDFDFRNLTANYLQMAKLFHTMHLYDSSFYYTKKTLENAERVSWKKAIYEASQLLATLFKLKDQPDSALVYAELSDAVRDSLYGPKKLQQLQLITLTEQERQQQLRNEKNELQNRYRLIALLSALGVFLLLAIILWRNNQKQKEVNWRLSEQKQQIFSQRNDLEKMLNELKSTQTQLIQAEKMASLGELTAGIAHEIQNPLNFVNNFSEVSAELVDEMNQELDQNNTNEAKIISNGIKQNLEKIIHHGKRADAIVKGMLQHSRTSTGQKEPTDINTLADEYLRLSYHGLRAKDKSFNATIQTDFDNSIGKINIIPQDIGRVLLNLYNNAFYAVAEKKKASQPSKQDVEYEPTVSVSTKRNGDKVELRVEDNGNGIPQKVLDKIFQPFFTTKPTGQGTGLGLSLSYDIIKAHRGEIRVETKEREWTEFTIII